MKYGKRFVVTEEFRSDAGIDVDGYLVSRTVPDGYAPVEGSSEIRWLDPNDPDDLMFLVEEEEPLPPSTLFAIVTVDCVPK